MNLNLSIIDQRLEGIQKEIREQVRDELAVHNDGRLKSCMKWNDTTEQMIHLAQFGDQVGWEYVNHDVLVGMAVNAAAW